VVNGRCIRSFPRHSRTATIDDNMISPEQGEKSAFETDLHTFVRAHFNQDVMEETRVSSQLVGIPGMDIVSDVDIEWNFFLFEFFIYSVN
jgi:hypothetical protein